ncbi:hypothetical protein LJB98_01800 [Bacteroidales bacterium OttesenSCG-928-M11]|nr:hypothetical protein [Bacteroidales bacterium OttesenSCG-928-M11]
MKNLEDAILEYSSDIAIVKRRSFQSGLKEIEDSHFDLILLDMSLPPYDITGEVEEEVVVKSGLNILIEMERQQINIDVVVITQFPSFGTGRDILTLDNIKEQMKQYKNYRKTIFYVQKETKWRIELINHIKLLKHHG